MDNEKVVTEPVYVTKWALTRGILVYPHGGNVRDAGQYFQGGDAARYGTDPAYCFVGPKHWTTDRAVALSRWNAEKQKKVRSLQKQVEKVKRLEAVFATVEPVK